MERITITSKQYCGCKRVVVVVAAAAVAAAVAHSSLYSCWWR